MNYHVVEPAPILLMVQPRLAVGQVLVARQFSIDTGVEIEELHDSHGNPVLRLMLLPAAATTVAVLGAEVSGVLPGMPPAALLVTKAAVGAAVGLPLVFLLARPAWREVAG